MFLLFFFMTSCRNFTSTKPPPLGPLPWCSVLASAPNQSTFFVSLAPREPLSDCLLRPQVSSSCLQRETLSGSVRLLRENDSELLECKQVCEVTS